MKIYWNTFLKKWVKPKPNQFPVGSRVYKGFQGSGKSLSMVKYALDISTAFPQAKIYSNMIIKGIDNFHYIENDGVLREALSCQNGEMGVLVLLDEAHLYFNKKGGIPLDVLTCISQQRKDRKRLVFSSQIWEELDISLRKQVKEIVSCRCVGRKFQINTISDGESLTYDKMQGAYVAKPIRTEIFKHYQELYDAYDTRQKIISTDNYHREVSANFSPTIIQAQTLTKGYMSVQHKKS